MTTACPNCGSQVAANERFCGECGTDMTATRALGDSARAAAPQPNQQYQAPYTQPLQPGYSGAVQPGQGGQPPYAPQPGQPYGPAQPVQNYQPGQPYAAPMGTPPAGNMAVELSGAQLAMLVFGWMCAVVSLAFFPICLGPIAIGLGWGVFAMGGVKGKAQGRNLMIVGAIAMVVGFIFGGLVAMTNM